MLIEKSCAKKVVRILFFAFPFIFGMIGFAIAGNGPFEEALFNCIRMYVINYSSEVPNIWVDIARWTAPFVTVSGVILAVDKMRMALSSYFRYFRGNSVAVYGDSADRTIFLEQLGEKGIKGEEKFLPASRYILTGSEEGNFAFYRAYRGRLKERMVYLKCRSLPAQSTTDANLKLFCPEEIAARLYWKQSRIYEVAKQTNFQMNVVFIGFGKLGEELLNWGLQNNIFFPNQRIAYHIIGNGEEYEFTHLELKSISDPVIFHGGPWYQNINWIERADLLIVVEQEQQEELLGKLLMAVTVPEIEVFASDSYIGELFDGKERLYPYFWKKEVFVLDNLFGNLLLERAKRINLRYSAIYNGIEETETNKELEWSKLNGFTRYSNISSADYHEVRLKMLEDMHISADDSGLSREQLELLSELEHIRWCRYHYLNNWKYGVPDNGKRKDAVNRIHRDLVSYESLGEGEKEKDRENIRILLSI